MDVVRENASYQASIVLV
jgi:vacuolar protein sorting-associated protein 26